MWHFYGAQLLFYLCEFVDFVYLFHVSSRDDSVWGQFVGASVLYYITSLLTARNLVSLLHPRTWLVLSCFVPHALFIPVLFSQTHVLYVPLFGIAGFFRLDTPAVVGVMETAVTSDQRMQRAYHLKILQYLSLLFGSILVFFMWIYPGISGYLVGTVHVVAFSYGLYVVKVAPGPEMPTKLPSFNVSRSPDNSRKRRRVHTIDDEHVDENDNGDESPLQEPNQSDLAQRISDLVHQALNMEAYVSFSYHSLVLYVMVAFTQRSVEYVAVANVCLSLICLLLIGLGYRLINHHNVNRFQGVFVGAAFLAVCFSMATWFAQWPVTSHVVINLAVVSVFSLVHLSPWQVLFQITEVNNFYAHDHTVRMVQYRILGQAFGMLLGMASIRLFRVAVYFPIFALGLVCVAHYEKSHKAVYTGQKKPTAAD